jgi:glycosyltransferase involved in cell wall biosynthesis
VSRPKISACILTYNSQRTIEACLKSIQWVDEIVVLDSLSTDGTPEIVRRYTQKIYRQPWQGNRRQYNSAREKASGEWILWVDSDEALSKELQEELQEVLTQDLSRIGGFSFPRRSSYLGRWIDHGGWYPDHVVRLAPREVTWEGKDPHPKIRVRGTVRALKAHILHRPYRHISDQIRTIDRYSSTAAREMNTAGKVFWLGTLLLHPPLRFLKEYVFKRGFRDGIPGLVIAVATAFYVFMKYAKLWEIERPYQGEQEIEDCAGDRSLRSQAGGR